MSIIIIDREVLNVVGHVEKHVHACMIRDVYYKDKDILLCDLTLKQSWSMLTQGELTRLLQNHTGQVMDSEQYDYRAALGSVFAFCANFPIQNVNVEALEYSLNINRADKTLKAPPPLPEGAVSESKPKAPSSGGAPSPKGATGRVWEIADAELAKFHEETDSPHNIKALRAAVITACVNAGINEATAGTQWSKWKKSKNF